MCATATHCRRKQDLWKVNRVAAVANMFGKLRATASTAEDVAETCVFDAVGLTITDLNTATASMATVPMMTVLAAPVGARTANITAKLVHSQYRCSFHLS